MLLNQKQACGYLGIGRYLFDIAVNKGLIPFIQPSKRRLFNTEDLDKWQKNTQNHLEFTNGAIHTTPISRILPPTDSVSSLEALRDKYFPKEQRSSALPISERLKKKSN